jgi:hypothetical protein
MLVRRSTFAAAAAALALLAAPSWAPPALESWFPRLRPGMWVEIEGALDSTGVLVASEIKILDGELDEWQLETLVGGVELARMTLSTQIGLRVVATEKTELEGPKGAGPVTFAAVGAGDRVEVEGRPQKDGSLLADRIEIEKPKHGSPPKNEHELKARVEEVDGENRRLKLMGISVQCDARTRNKTKFVD